MKKFDIVYILKNDVKSEELRYSLRSVCENFPYKRIIFVGGCPDDIRPDVYIEHQQLGITKWQRARSSLMKILRDENITEDFFLFNDDFYVLSKQSDNFVNFTNGTLEKRVDDLIKKNGTMTNYALSLNNTLRFLKKQDKDTMNFAVHMPMLINRKKALDILTRFPKEQMFRSIYGNMAEVDYINHKDVKIYDVSSLPKYDDYLSTCDNSFKHGVIGQWIKERFPNPCKYEMEVHNE